MRTLRFLGNVALWLVAVVGVLSALIFGATQLGYLKPLVVISGSMEPKIMTGDLLFDTPHPTSELKVGDVVAIQSQVTGKLISHRVVNIVAKDGRYEVNLKGDANQSPDGETYVVGDTVWRPVLQVPHGGLVVTKLTQRGVAVPLGITLLALLALTLFPGDGGRPRGPGHEASSALSTVEPVEAEGALADAIAGEVEPQFPDRIADLTGAQRS